MQCHGWSTAIRSLQFSAFRSTFTPYPARNASSFIFPARPVSRSRYFASTALANAPELAIKHQETDTSSKLSSAALARAASQTIRMCAKEKQFGDALYILNSMRFSIYPQNSNSPPPPSERTASTQDSKRECSQLLSSAPSINGYTFINFGQPVPTRLASHTFLHSLVKAGLPTKAAAQAKLMMADGICIRTKTMESILASIVDRSSYPPAQSLKAPREGARLDVLSRYPITDTHTSVAVRLLEEARHRRQERTQRMYDVVINACLIQGEIIVASLLFLILLKDWQLRLKKKHANNPSSEPPEPLNPSPLRPPPRPTSQPYWSLLNRIDHTLATLKDPQDPQFQDALQALANLAFVMDTGPYPPELMASLIKALYSVPKSHAVVYVGSPPNGPPVNAYEYFHEVLMRLVYDARRVRDRQTVLETGRRFKVNTLHALLHYCLRYRMSKALASDILEVLKNRKRGITVDGVNILFRGSTLLRDDTIRMDEACSNNTPDSIPVALSSTHRTTLPSTRWAHIVDVLKLEHALRYPSEPVIHTPVTPDDYTATDLITHLVATGRGSILSKKLYEIIPELDLVDRDGLGITMEERDRCLALYGPYFFTTVLNALVKTGRIHHAELVWELAIAAEKASWRGETEPWFLPIHAYTSMLQLYSDEMRAGKPKRLPRGNKGSIPAMVKGKSIFRTVQIRCRFLEAVKRSDPVGRIPLRLRKFIPDERYFNALLDLYSRRGLGYARPMRNRNNYWRWMERLASDRFAKNGASSVHWHPMLTEIITEMGRYGYGVPGALRFLLVGRVSGTERAGPPLAHAARPISLPSPRQNPQFIPVLKTRGLPVRRGRRTRPRRAAWGLIKA